MTPRLPAILSGISTLLFWGISAIAQKAPIYTIRSSEPQQVHTGNDDTTILLTGAARSDNAYGYSICFYTGGDSAPIKPSSFDAKGASFTVDASRLQLTRDYRAQVYLAPATGVCTGTNPGFSNAITIPVTTGQLYTITAASPNPIPIGSNDLQIDLSGRTSGPDKLDYGVCFFDGTETQPITTTSFTTTDAIFTVPSTYFHLAETDASVYLGPLKQTCTGKSIGVSNTFTIPLAFPVTRSANVSTLPQPNQAIGGLSYPTNLALTGSYFNPTPNTGAVFYGVSVSSARNFLLGTTAPGRLLANGNIVVPAPTFDESGSDFLQVAGCNANASDFYCSSEPVRIGSFLLAGTTTDVVASNATPDANQAVNLTATITPGPGSDTDGGTYVPGPPSGTVAFSDGQTALGSARLVGSNLKLTFDSAPAISGRTGQTSAPIIADFNQDGLPDTLLVDSSSSLLHLFLGGSPAGVLNQERIISGTGNCASIPGAAIADFNGDGYPDIAYLCGNGNNGTSLYFLFNQGDGSFGSPTNAGVLNRNMIVSAASLIATGDVNGDGLPDLVIAGNTTGNQGVPAYGFQPLFGNGKGGFSAGPTTTLYQDPGFRSTGAQLVVKDLNNDGKADLALLATAFESTGVQLYQNDKTGVFLATGSIPVCNCSISGTKLFVAPLSPSLYPDIVVAFSGTTGFPGLIVARNSRSAQVSFGSPATQQVESLSQAVLGDFTGDGLPDVAYFDGELIRILQGDGAGKFTAGSFAPYNPGVGFVNQITLVGAPDLNSDGYADLLSISQGDGATLGSFITTGTATATLAAKFADAGSHTIATTYPGNTDLLGSPGQGTVIVKGTTLNPPDLSIFAPPSTTASTAAIRTFVAGQAFSLNFVASTPGVSHTLVIRPTGSIKVYEGSVLLGTASLTPSSSSLFASLAYLPFFGNATAGTHVFSIVYSGDAAFAPLTTPFTYTILPATPTVTWSPLSTLEADASIGPVGGKYLNAAASVAGAFSYTPAPGSFLPAGSQQVTALFTPADALDYARVTTTRNITVTKSALTSFGLSAAPANQTAGSGVPTVLTALLLTTTLAADGSVRFLDGQLVLGSVPVGDAVRNLKSVTLSIPSPGAGNHNYTAVYSGDAVYNPATSNTVTYTVGGAVPVITFAPNPATIPYGTRLGTAQLDATANVPGSFTYSPALNTLLGGGAHVITATFKPNDLTAYQSATKTAVVTVSPIAPAISWTPASPIAQGTALTAAQLDAVAHGYDGLPLAGTYSYTPALGAVLQAGTQTLSVLFTPADATDYTPATATMPLAVSVPGTRTVLSANPNPSQPGGTVTLIATVNQTGTSTAALAGTVSFLDGSKTLGTASVTGGSATFSTAALALGTHTLAAVYSGSASYTGSTSGPVVETVSASPVQITWLPSPVAIPYGTPLGSGQLDAMAKDAAGATIPGTFTYTPAPGTRLHAGVQTLSVSFQPSSTGFAPATGTARITVTPIAPAITWTPASPIAQGTALTAAQLDAVAHGYDGLPLAGTYSYTPALGAVLQAGTQTLSVLFTLTDSTDYTPATATVPLAVSVPVAKVALSSLVNPTQFGQATTLSAAVSAGGTSAAIPTGAVTFLDGTKVLGSVTLSASGVATLPVSNLATGGHTITATYAGDLANAFATSSPLVQTVNKAASIVTFIPNPATIVYGTPISAAQLDASVTSLYVANVPGFFAYNQQPGTVPGAGTVPLSTVFTPADPANFTTVIQTANLTVIRAVPTLSFPTPPAIAVGTAVSTAPFNASATGVTGASLPGSYAYTSSAGSIVTTGPQVITVVFTPNDAVDYSTASASITLNGTSFALTALDSSLARLGDPDKTITLTGTGFLPDAYTRINGTQISTTFVNSTTLTAVIPAANFLLAQTVQITVVNPSSAQTSAALPFVVIAPPLTGVTLNAPSSAAPGEQPHIQFSLANPYPVPITGTLSLTFAPISGGVVDPNIQFITGGQNYMFTVPAGQTSGPNIQIQTGTVAGTITIVLKLTAGGVDVTPSSIAPFVINLPPYVPGLLSVTLIRDGRTLTVKTVGYSNTREATKVQFHFTPASGQQIETQDIPIDIGSIFSGYYALPASDVYGSEFLYTQTFTLDDDNSVVGQVTVTLSNSVGVSASGSSQ